MSEPDDVSPHTRDYDPESVALMEEYRQRCLEKLVRADCWAITCVCDGEIMWSVGGAVPALDMASMLAYAHEKLAADMKVALAELRGDELRALILKLQEREESGGGQP